MPINTPEQRKLQSERIKRVKPWLKCKGTKTEEGKRISSMNALKTSPEMHTIMKKYKQLMKHQREMHDLIPVSFS